MGKGDYKVGFGKPPKSGQFKPGQSGNPKGRSKGTKNLKTDLAEELGERIMITEGGKAKKLSKQRALLKALMAKALKGDTRATGIIVGMVDRYLGDADTSGSAISAAGKSDDAILEAFKAQILAEAKNGKM